MAGTGKTYLHRRGARYYARVPTPTDLQKLQRLAGEPVQTEVSESLRTADRAEADRRLLARVQRIQRRFGDEITRLRAKVRLDSAAPAEGEPTERREQRIPSEHDLQIAAFEFVRNELELDERIRASLPTREQIEGRRERLIADAKPVANSRGAAIQAASLEASLAAYAEQPSARAWWRAAFAEELRAALHTNDFTSIQWAIDDCAERKGFTIDVGSVEHRQLARMLLVAQLQIIKAANARDDGDYGVAQNVVAQLTPPPVPPTKASTADESIPALLERYLGEIAATQNAKEIEHKRKRIMLFAEHFGMKRSVREIDRAALRDWKHGLQRYPINARQRFPKKSFARIVKENDRAKLPTIAAKTINHYITAMGAFLTWLEAHDYVQDGELTRRLLVPVNKEASTRPPFASDELRALFRLPVFTGAVDADRINAHGNHRVVDHRFWIPLLILYSGARPNELPSLRVADVKELHGTWVMLITSHGEKDEFGLRKRQKNKNSSRVLPIHPELIRLGFVRFVDRQRRNGAARIFSQLTPDSFGSLTKDVSRWFTRYVTSAGIKQPSLYRLRHNFADALRMADFTNEEIGPLMGHKDLSMTEHYGSVAPGTLSKRVAMIASIRYDELALTPPQM